MSDEYDIPIEDGILRPLASTPEREREVWRNSGLRESLARGLRDSEAGEVHNLGSFADPIVVDLDDPYFNGQTLPAALSDYAHVHSTTGVCVKKVGDFCSDATPPPHRRRPPGECPRGDE